MPPPALFTFFRYLVLRILTKDKKNYKLLCNFYNMVYLNICLSVLILLVLGLCRVCKSHFNSISRSWLNCWFGTDAYKNLESWCKSFLTGLWWKRTAFFLKFWLTSLPQVSEIGVALFFLNNYNKQKRKQEA